MVVGTRSAVFAPVRDLGLVIVDEEHDGSYKQEETPRYHGRDVAVMRAKLAGATVVLGSATPSLESWANAERGRYRLIEMKQRVMGRALPEVELVDMRAEFAGGGEGGDIQPAAGGGDARGARAGGAGDRAAEPAGVLVYGDLPELRGEGGVRELRDCDDVSQGLRG